MQPCKIIVNTPFSALNLFMHEVQKCVLHLHLHMKLFTISNYSALCLVM